MFDLTKAERKALLFVCIFLLFGALVKNFNLLSGRRYQYSNRVARAVKMVNVNTASVRELTSLNGIGPAIAQRIIEYRDKTGPFKSKEDLLKVKGIGPQKFIKISPYLSFNGDAVQKPLPDREL